MEPLEAQFGIKTFTPRDRRPIKNAGIDSPDPVDAPRYPVYCLTPSEHRDTGIIRLSFFCDTKKGQSASCLGTPFKWAVDLSG